jgi:hypothetical protein
VPFWVKDIKVGFSNVNEGPRVSKVTCAMLHGRDGTMLYALEIPELFGLALGDTEFAITTAAWDALLERMRQPPRRAPRGVDFAGRKRAVPPTQANHRSGGSRTGLYPLPTSGQHQSRGSSSDRIAFARRHCRQPNTERRSTSCLISPTLDFPPILGALTAEGYVATLVIGSASEVRFTRSDFGMRIVPCRANN